MPHYSPWCVVLGVSWWNRIYRRAKVSFATSKRFLLNFLHLSFSKVESYEAVFVSITACLTYWYRICLSLASVSTFLLRVDPVIDSLHNPYFLFYVNHFKIYDLPMQTLKLKFRAQLHRVVFQWPTIQLDATEEKNECTLYFNYKTSFVSFFRDFWIATVFYRVVDCYQYHCVKW